MSYDPHRIEKKRRGIFSVIMMLSLAFHVVLLIAFGSFKIWEAVYAEETEFEAAVMEDAPPPEREIPKLQPEDVSDFNPPETMKVAQVSDLNVSQIEIPLPEVRGNVGVSIGDGALDFAQQNIGMVDIDFFGLKGSGRNIAYVADFSLSMRGAQDKMMREELSRSIQELPKEANVSLIMFAGPVWPAGENPKEVEKDWIQIDKQKDDWEDKARQAKDSIWGWRMKKGASAPNYRWQAATTGTINNLVRAVEETRLIYGTDWGPPFEAAFSLDPKPDVIFFMTDGAPQAKYERGVVSDYILDEARRGDVNTQINSVAFGRPSAFEMMEEVSKRTGGDFRIIKIDK